MFLKILIGITMEISRSQPEQSILSSIGSLGLDPFESFVWVAMGCRFESAEEVQGMVMYFYGAAAVRRIASLATSYIDGEGSSKGGVNENGKRRAPDEDFGGGFIESVLGWIGVSDEGRRRFFKEVEMDTITEVCERECKVFLRRVSVFVYARWSTRLFVEFDVSTILQGEADTSYGDICRDFNQASKRTILGEVTRQPTLPILFFDMPLGSNRVELPLRFDTLFEQSCTTKCRSCDSIPETPALCLICGAFLCLSSFCCTTNNTGECTSHMSVCGGEVGLYLLPKRGAVLFLAGGLGCFLRAPYLDAHGETDVGLRNGRTLLLVQERYEELMRVYEEGGLHGYVSRNIWSMHGGTGPTEFARL
jgi:hypothetical protein